MLLGCLGRGDGAAGVAEIGGGGGAPLHAVPWQPGVIDTRRVLHAAV